MSTANIESKISQDEFGLNRRLGTRALTIIVIGVTL